MRQIEGQVALAATALWFALLVYLPASMGAALAGGGTKMLEVAGLHPLSGRSLFVEGLRFSLLAGLLVYGPRWLSLAWAEAYSSNKGPSLKVQPLPGQSRALDRLQGRLEDLRSRGGTVGLTGHWGSGKTTVLDILSDRVSGSGQVCVSVSAWRLQTEWDLEYALMREILADRTVRRVCWDIVPWYRLQLWPTVGRLSGSIDAKVLKVGFEMPKVNWHGTLSRIASRLHDRDIQLVLLLDELDRTAAKDAQRFLTLTQRFAGIPNLAIVVPYVPDQLRYKAFNPATTWLPDLKDTLAAVLYRYRSQLLVHCPPSPPSGQSGGSPSGTLADDLIRAFQYCADPVLQEQIIQIVEEKYYPNPIRLENPSPDDIRELIRREVALGPAITRAFDLNADELEQVANAAEIRWRELVAEGLKGPFHLSVRHIARFIQASIEDVPVGSAKKLDTARFAVAVGLQVAAMGEL